jgi:hypothetical protein
MKYKRLLLLCLIAILSACTVRGPEVAVRPPGVEVKPAAEVRRYYYSHPPARHCPPGHAKKGWC